MVSPQINSAYGAALQFSADLPTIANLAIHTADLQHSSAMAGDQQRQQNAALGAQSANENMNRIAQSQNANANREQNALDLGAQLDAHANANMLHANTGIIQQQRGAELAAWANGQEMTQADNMRLQQMNRALDHVMNDPNLGPVGEMTPDRSDIVTQLRTGIDPLRQRQEREQTKQMQMHTQLYQAQLQQKQEETKAMAAVNQMTAAQRVFHQLDPDAQAELESQNMTPFERDAKQKELMKGGHYQTFVIDPDGSLKQIKREHGTAAAKPVELKPFDVTKAWKDAVAEATLAHPDDSMDDKNKPFVSADKLAERNAYATKVFGRLRDLHNRQPGNDPHPDVTQPATGGSPTSDSPVTPEELNLPWTPGDPNAKTTAYQKEAVGKLSSSLQQLEARTDLPESMKKPFVEAAHGLHALMAKYGWLGNPRLLQDRQDAARLDFYTKTLNNVPPMPEPSQEEKLRKQRESAPARKLGGMLRSTFSRPNTATLPDPTN